MSRRDVCTLIGVQSQLDAYGVSRPQTETRQVRFCRVQSVSGTEFFEAGQAGIRPQYRFTLPRAEYSGEQTVEYQGRRYTVYRTYEPSARMIELYVEARVGDGKEKRD